MVISEIRTIDDEVEKLLQEANRKGTQQNFKTQISAYYMFCEKFSFQELPADSRQITRFAVYLHLYKQLKPETIANYVSAVRTLHGLLEMPIPQTDTVVHKMVMKGIKTRNKKPKCQAEAITPKVLKMISKHIDKGDYLELVAWTATLIGFHCLLRASNLTSRSVASFNQDENLLRRDFRMHNNILLVHIKWTKTLQYREKKLLIPVIPFADPEIDAVKCFHEMLSAVPATSLAPAFAVPTKQGLAPLTYSQLSEKLKKWTKACQLDATKYTSHCLRRGGASWLDEQGVPESVIAVLGDWRTNAFKNYIDSALNTRMKAMVMFANTNNKTFY